MKIAKKLAAAVTLGLILLGLALGLCGAAVAATAAPPNPCSHPDALLRAGHYADAEAAYSALPPTDACAQPGMAASNALLAASLLISDGQPGPAADDIARAVNADPTLILSTGVLSPAVEQQAIALAKRLQADGFHQQAVQVLLFVIDARHGVRLDPAAQAILAPPAQSPWTWIRPFLLSWPGFTFLVAFALLGLLVLQRTRRRLHLQPFALDDSVAGVDPEGLRNRVQDELKRLVAEDVRTTGKRRPRIDVAGPYDDRVPIAALIDQGGPQAQFVKALLDVLYDVFPRLSVPRLVTGTLKPGVTIRMGMRTLDMVERDAATIEFEKLDVRKLGIPRENPSAAATSDDAAHYAHLALPAAAWVILRWYKRCTLCGTRDLDSFSLFAIGRAWQDLGKLAEAEQCYAAARDKDPGNLGAALNLARLWQRNGLPPGSPGQPGDSWSALLDEVAKATRTRRHRLQWHQSRYLLSLGLSDSGDMRAGAEPAPEEREKARRLAVDLALRIEKQLRPPGWTRWIRWIRRRGLPREFLDNSRGPALALAASQLIPGPATLTVQAVSTTGANPKKAKDGDIIRTLKDARKGRDVQPQILASAAEEQYPKDDEVAYNLYQYQRRRAQACDDAINEITRQLRQPSRTGKAVAEAEKKLAGFVAARDEASNAARRYRDQLEDAEDAVVQRRLATVDEADHRRERYSFTGNDYPRRPAPMRRPQDL